MITWVMVGLLLAAETCGRNVLSGNGNGKEESKQKDGLKGITAEEEDIYRGYSVSKSDVGQKGRREGERDREREREGRVEEKSGRKGGDREREREYRGQTDL